MNVELHPAYWFTCDECGVEQFVKGTAPELTDEEQRELRDEHGIETWTEGVFCRVPGGVQCCECGAEFQTSMHEHRLGQDEEETE